MATVPPATLWQPWEIPTSNMFNARIRDPINFFKISPLCVMRKAAAQSISSGNWTAVTWSTEDIDSDNSHDIISFPERFVSKTAGWYLVNVTIGWSYAASLYRKVRIRKNGKDLLSYGEHTLHVDNQGSDAQDITTAAYVYLEVFDYIEIMVHQDSGGNVNVINDGLDSRLEVRWVGISSTEKLSLPNSYTWLNGLLSSEDLNVNMRDAYAFLLSPPHAIYAISKNSQEMIGNGPSGAIGRVIEWDEIVQDSYGTFNNNIFTAPVSGIYHIILQISIKDFGRAIGYGRGDDRRFGIWKNLPSNLTELVPNFAMYLNYPEQGADITPMPRTDSYTLTGDIRLLKGDTLAAYAPIQGNQMDTPEIVPLSRWDIRWVANY